ncbi:MAG: hypothetical protein ABWZ03_01195 [Solirubrobacterales bacterium]
MIDVLDRFCSGFADRDAEAVIHPYRMTMVLEHRDDRWLLTQVHGSSPQALANPVDAKRSRRR